MSEPTPTPLPASDEPAHELVPEPVPTEPVAEPVPTKRVMAASTVPEPVAAASPVEPVAEPVPTQPVVAASPSGPSSPGGAPARRRRRWILALGAVALLLGSTAVAAVMLAGASSDSVVARWAPADSVVYVEVRADLPGDQRAALGELLSAFPGFADQATLDRKLAELYERLLDAASDGKQSYSADIEPWFGGRLGVSVGPLPEITSLEDPTAAAETARVLVVVAVDDAAAAEAWVRSTVEAAGGAVRTTDAGGSELLLIGPEDHPAAAATADGVLLLGDETSVRAALERDGENGLATIDGYDEAISALDGQQSAVMYLDGKAYLDWAMSLPSTSGLPTDLGAIKAMMPAWMAGGLRIEPDALVGSAVSPHASGAPALPDAASELPARLPPTTAVLVDVHGAGAAFEDGWAQGLEGLPPDQLAQIEDLIRMFGGIDGIIGWVDELGLVVLTDGTRALPGIAAVPTDVTAAENLGRTVANSLTLAGLAPTEEAYAGTTISVVDLGPTGADPVAGIERIQLSWAITDEIVAIGIDPAFVRAVLDAQDGDTLADQDQFKALLDRAGKEHRSLVYADIDALEVVAVASLTPTERARYESDVKPYLAPLDALIGVYEGDGSYDRNRMLLVIEQGQ